MDIDSTAPRLTTSVRGSKKKPTVDSNEVLQDSSRIKVLFKLLTLIQALEERIHQRDSDRHAIEELKRSISVHQMVIRTKISNLLEKAWKLNDMTCYECKPTTGAAPHKSPNLSRSNDISNVNQMSLLDEIIRRLDFLEKGKQIPRVTSEHSALYGVAEMTDRYQSCIKCLMECLESIKLVRGMPTLICNTNVIDGIYSIQEVDIVIHVLEIFTKKLLNSLAHSQFAIIPQ